MTITPRNEYKEKVTSKMPYLYSTTSRTNFHKGDELIHGIMRMQCLLIDANTSSKTEGS